MLMRQVQDKILKIWDTFFELIQTEVEFSKNYFKIFLPQEAGAFGNNIEKQPQMRGPRLEKYLCYIFTGNICTAWNPMQVVDSCKNVLIL